MTIRTTWQALDHVKSLLTDGPVPWTQSYEFFSNSIIFSHMYMYTHSPSDRIKYTVGFFGAFFSKKVHNPRQIFNWTKLLSIVRHWCLVLGCVRQNSISSLHHMWVYCHRYVTLDQCSDGDESERNKTSNKENMHAFIKCKKNFKTKLQKWKK